jgi:hypothetical protein
MNNIFLSAMFASLNRQLNSCGTIKDVFGEERMLQRLAHNIKTFTLIDMIQFSEINFKPEDQTTSKTGSNNFSKIVK